MSPVIILGRKAPLGKYYFLVNLSKALNCIGMCRIYYWLFYLRLLRLRIRQKVVIMSKWRKVSRHSLLCRGGRSIVSYPRGERLQIMLTVDELDALDQWRFSRHMPSRAAAVRELLRRGLAAEGFDVSDGKTKSAEFGVIVDIAKRG